MFSVSAWIISRLLFLRASWSRWKWFWRSNSKICCFKLAISRVRFERWSWVAMGDLADLDELLEVNLTSFLGGDYP